MGFLGKIFNPSVAPPQPSMPNVTTGLTQNTINAIMSGKLVRLNISKVVLQKGEECYFCDHAVRIDERLQVVGRQRTGGGFSIRIMKGISYHTGNGGSMTVREKVQDYQEGNFYITNKRMIFSASEKSFSKRIADLISYNIQDGNLILQFEKGDYCIHLPIVECAEQIIKLLL